MKFKSRIAALLNFRFGEHYIKGCGDDSEGVISRMNLFEVTERID
jgi:hypothetical protein